MTKDTDASAAPSNFIRDIIDKDLADNRHGGRVHTRFPPEPNGYLHIGHAKSICLNFGLARDYDGKCNLRFDDTNPAKEETEYVDAIRKDVSWLGFSWDDREFYASDYFDKLYEFAVKLIKAGKAYVESLTAEEMRDYRGTLTEPGRNSPYRDRSVEENLDLFERMKAGEFEDGACVLRAKIDMASPNLIMRDPTLYRIKRAHHHRTGDAWVIYPMYDFTHCLSDALENVTHSLCTLEFQPNRELYDWMLDQFPEDFDPASRTRQYEFARMNLTHTVLSKRRLIQLVEESLVGGWDDPRMPTLSGLRRRGVTPEAVRDFCERIGVSKADNMVDYSLLEFCLRDHLNQVAPRVMGVLNPLKMVIENYPEDQAEEFDCPLHPEDESYGTRKMPISKTLYVERDDFREQANKKWYRLAPGKEVRFKFAYYITCTDVIKDEAGEIVELRGTYDPATRGGWSEDGRKVKGTIHWVSAECAKPMEVRLYDRLFTKENPMKTEEGEDFKDFINPDSLTVNTVALLEPGALGLYNIGDVVQFERTGYFCLDPDSTDDRPVFNKTVGLRDSWAKVEKKG